MSTSVVYYPSSIYLPGGTSITQIADVTPSNNFQDLTAFSASEPTPQFTGTHQASPDNRFSTTQIKTFLDQVGTTAANLNLVADYSAAGTVMVEYKAGVIHGTRIADADNGGIVFSMANNAGMYFESLRARQGSVAEIRARLAAIFLPASGNDPMTVATAADLSATAAVAHLFTLGKITLNGTTLTGVEELDWNNNLQYEEVADSGEGFCTYIGVRDHAPLVRILTNNCNAMSTFGTRGTAITTCNFYLRKKLISGINVPDATAGHIRLQSTAGTIKAREISGSKGMCVVELQLAAPSASAPAFTVNTAIAVP